jgi:hypothetical protein
MLQELLNELAETWDFTTEEINDIREKMYEYGISCIDEFVKMIFSDEDEQKEEKVLDTPQNNVKVEAQ